MFFCSNSGYLGIIGISNLESDYFLMFLYLLTSLLWHPIPIFCPPHHPNGIYYPQANFEIQGLVEKREQEVFRDAGSAQIPR